MQARAATRHRLPQAPFLPRRGCKCSGFRQRGSAARDGGCQLSGRGDETGVGEIPAPRFMECRNFSVVGVEYEMGNLEQTAQDVTVKPVGNDCTTLAEEFDPPLQPLFRVVPANSHHYRTQPGSAAWPLFGAPAEIAVKPLDPCFRIVKPVANLDNSAFLLQHVENGRLIDHCLLVRPQQAKEVDIRRCACDRPHGKCHVR